MNTERLFLSHHLAAIAVVLLSVGRYLSLRDSGYTQPQPLIAAVEAERSESASTPQSLSKDVRDLQVIQDRLLLVGLSRSTLQNPPIHTERIAPRALVLPVRFFTPNLPLAGISTVILAELPGFPLREPAPPASPLQNLTIVPDTPRRFGSTSRAATVIWPRSTRRNGFLMRLQLCSLLAAAAVATVSTVCLAQKPSAVPTVPTAELPQDAPSAAPEVRQEQSVGEPVYIPADLTFAVPSCPPAAAAPAMLSAVLLYLSQYAAKQPISHGMVPLARSAPMCCMTPISPTEPWYPPPATQAGIYCPTAQTAAPMDLISTPEVMGYLFHLAPIYTNSPATRFHMHSMRKDALLRASRGNMFPMAPISPVGKGSYHFRPYNYRQIYFDQIYAATASGNPEAPDSAPLLPHLADRLDACKQSEDRAVSRPRPRKERPDSTATYDSRTLTASDSARQHRDA